ncbi:MAG TPA: folylpolyglutamate synthase/dihydrofolate synthase family protein [Chthoniobacteraceae bacterium]|jgi:dihydrofolate synthase/folylpolyglutamate synthase|nr:folylpolyglutamate synthase/dihydrofolate synthase family protein [Chthoniobacteraceae bacterium]
MRYPEALAWLYGTQKFSIKLGLDRVRMLAHGLGWRAEQRCLHIAGTNGKGSVCAMLDSVLRAAGHRSGLFTSPHLVTFRERIQMDGLAAEDEEIAAELTRIRDWCEQADAQPTFFEIATALALMLFQQRKMELVVLETGLGGRLDSTNIVTPLVSVITSIGMDHMQYLGGTLEEIAWEKAGIIKPGVPVVTGVLPRQAAEVIGRVAAERESPLIAVSEPVADMEIGLKGSHQCLNAAVALHALEAAGIAISHGQALEGLRMLHWPARFQDTGRGFILDGAHNPEAAARLVQTWREEYGGRRAEIIVGIVRDKDARGICAELAAIAGRFTVVPVPGPRGGSVQELMEIAGALRPTRACASLAEAIATTPREEMPALIAGSFFLMGEALVALGLAKEPQEISAQ